MQFKSPKDTIHKGANLNDIKFKIGKYAIYRIIKHRNEERAKYLLEEIVFDLKHSYELKHATLAQADRITGIMRYLLKQNMS